MKARQTTSKARVPAAAIALKSLQQNLEARATDKSRAFWSRYLKGNASFRGVPMAGVRRAVHAWWESERFDDGSVTSQKQVALRLFEEHYTEDKLAGVLLLSEILLTHLSIKDLSSFARLFARGHIADWNLCDWFCIKVLGKMLEHAADPTALARAISLWRLSKPLWQRRASCVAFVNHARHGERYVRELPHIVLESCQAVVHDPQRFAQTGVGWVLRELSLFDKRCVIAFAERNLELLSRECIKSMCEKLPARDKRRLLGRHENTMKRSRKASRK